MSIVVDASVEIKDHSGEVLDKLGKGYAQILEVLGFVAERYASENAPVDTGRLRASITHQVVLDELAVYIGTNVEYAPYVELGTSRMKPRPYLKPAIENHLNEYKNIIDDMLKKI